MGIKNLHSFLKKKCPHIYKTVPLSSYQDKTIAIDLSIYLFKYKIVYGVKWLDAFLNMITNFKEHQIQIIFIYDTKAPPEKDGERKNRSDARAKLRDRLETIKKGWEEVKKSLKETQIDFEYDSIKEKNPTFYQFLVRNSSALHTIECKVVEDEIYKMENSLVHITVAEFNTTKELFELCGVPYINAEGEAESLCASLNIYGHVDATLTDDTDVLAYLTPIMLHKLNFEEQTFVEIHSQDILKELKLSPPEFLDFCILCGTDYNTTIQKIGFEKAYKLIKEYHSLENIGKETDFDVSVLNFPRIRDLFKEPHLGLSFKKPMLKTPDVPKLQEFCFLNNCQFDCSRLCQIDLKKNEKRFKHHVRVL